MKLFVAVVLLGVFLPSYKVEAFLAPPLCTRKSAYATLCRSQTLETSPQSSNDEVQEENLIVLEVDEDHEELRTYEDFHRKFTKLMEERSYENENLGKEAQSVFDEMFEAYISSEDSSLCPNITIYNILLDAHARSQSPEGGIEAEQILDRMEDITNEMIARPNKLSYINVMNAWAIRKDPSKVQEIIDRLQKRFEENADTDFEPDTDVYNKLIKAWMKSDFLDKSEQAEKILKNMIQKYEEGNNILLMPSQESFAQVINCYGKLKTKKGLEKVLENFKTMKKLYKSSRSPTLRPNTLVYNELILAAAKNKEITDRAERGETFLYEMLEAANGGNDALQPNAATFENVFKAHKRNPDSGHAYKVEKLIELQRNSGVPANVDSYRAALEAIGWTWAPDKASMCWNLIQTMKDENIQPDVKSYNAVLNACAYSSERENPTEIFSIALDAFNQLRDEKDECPDMWTYSLFLRSCSRLVPKSPQRDTVIQNIFMECSQEGLVGRSMLSELLDTGSEELVVTILGDDPRKGIKIPRNWSRNIKDEKQLLKNA